MTDSLQTLKRVVDNLTASTTSGTWQAAPLRREECGLFTQIMVRPSKFALTTDSLSML